MYRKFFKRAFDIVFSFIAIIVFLVPMLIIAVIVRADSKGSVFFKQKRIGKDKKNFYMLKFRSMYVDTPHDVPTHLMKDPHAFITRPGRILRLLSLDELPQLFNIFVGQMSFVGPRPALWNQFDLIEERDKYGANDIRPGLTGWAQVNGRDELAIDVKARYDGEYTKKISLAMDIKCLIMTVSAVFSRKGFAEGAQTENTTEKEEVK